MLDVILVGAGLRGSTRLRTWPPAGGRVVAIVEPAVERRRALSLPDVRFYDSLADALSAETTALLVDICTPPLTHKSLVIEALQAGRHVLCEKPFVASMAEAEEIREVAASSPGRVVVMHNYLGSPEMIALRNMTKSAAVGEVFSAHCTWVESHERDTQGMADSSHWVHRLGGGRLEETLPHIVYSLVAIVQDTTLRPEYVRFEKRTSYPWVKADTLSVSLAGEKGTASLFLSFGVKRTHIAFKAIGSTGAAETSFDTHIAERLGINTTNRGKFDPVERLYRLAEGSLRRVAGAVRHSEHTLRRHTWDHAVMQGVVQSIETGSAPPVSLDEAIATVRITREICDQLPTAVVHDSRSGVG